MLAKEPCFIDPETHLQVDELEVFADYLREVAELIGYQPYGLQIQNCSLAFESMKLVAICMMRTLGTTLINDVRQFDQMMRWSGADPNQDINHVIRDFLGGRYWYGFLPVLESQKKG